jgi:hypothetical protein
MKKVIIISMALILSSILLWNSGDRKVTAEEIAQIDPMWVLHCDRGILNADSSEKSVYQTKIESEMTFSNQDNGSETPDDSFITKNLRGNISKMELNDTF